MLKFTTARTAVIALTFSAIIGGTAADAAILNWTSDTFDNVTDVSTVGTLVTAINLGEGTAATTPVSVNGVTFAADPAGVQANLFVSSIFENNVSTVFDDSAHTITGLSAANANFLLDTFEGSSGTGNSLARLTGLTIGRQYLVQLLVVDDRNGGQTHDFGYSTPSGNAAENYTLTGVSQTTPSVITAIFFATEASQDIHVRRSTGSNGVVGAFQVRLITTPEPSSALLVLLGAIGLSMRRRRRRL